MTIKWRRAPISALPLCHTPSSTTAISTFVQLQTFLIKITFEWRLWRLLLAKLIISPVGEEAISCLLATNLILLQVAASLALTLTYKLKLKLELKLFPSELSVGQCKHKSRAWLARAHLLDGPTVGRNLSATGDREHVVVWLMGNGTVVAR